MQDKRLISEKELMCVNPMATHLWPSEADGQTREDQHCYFQHRGLQRRNGGSGSADEIKSDSEGTTDVFGILTQRWIEMDILKQRN